MDAKLNPSEREDAVFLAKEPRNIASGSQQERDIIAASTSLIQDAN